MALIFPTVRGGFNPHNNLSGVSELDRISHQIDQDLA